MHGAKVKTSFCPSPPAAQKEKFYLVASPTSCQVESGFSWVIPLLSKNTTASVL
jgi:hypothetical protein